MAELETTLAPGIERSDEFTVARVGFELCVKHVAAAAEGALCRTRATLREVVEGRKLRFEVEVTEGERTIGIGTHERRVVAFDQLGSPAS